MTYSIIHVKGVKVMADKDLIESMIVELRRGTQILLVLDALSESQYGYSLLQKLESRGVLIEAGTLYPLLRRLDAQGLLESSWDTSESRPRKYYQLNKKGHTTLKALKNTWLTIVKEMNQLFEEDQQ